MPTKVSIIVPVYNAEKYLKPCIESVLNQDYKDLELVLVDDGSMDSSPQICQSFSDSRVRYIRKENGGVSSARNIGIDCLSKDSYTTFLDSDDTLPSNAISSLVKALEESAADIAIGSFDYVYGDIKKPHSNRLLPGTYDLKLLLPFFIDDGTLSGFLIGSVCASLYKTDIILSHKIKFDTNIKNNEDGLFNFEFVIKANTLCVISDCVYNYRQYENSSSSKRKREYDFNGLISEKLLQLPWDREANRYNEQMKARNVSLALWDILQYTRYMSLKEGVVFISQKIRSREVREGINYIEFRKLSRYKKIFAYLIKFKQSVMLYIVVKYLYPFLRKRLKR